MPVLSVRIPKALMEMIKEYVRRDTHATLSDFVRDALREKIKAEAPRLYRRMLEEGEKAEP